MKKLNNKGMTIIEILVCFVLVMTISASLYTTIAMYNNKKHEEDIKQAIYKYKILLTEEIYSDILHRRIRGVTLSGNKATLTFAQEDKVLTYDSTSITYGDTRYPLPKVRDKNQLKFKNASLSTDTSTNVFNFEIKIQSDTFGDKYGIKIISPINLETYYE